MSIRDRIIAVLQRHGLEGQADEAADAVLHEIVEALTEEDRVLDLAATDCSGIASQLGGEQ